MTTLKYTKILALIFTLVISGCYTVSVEEANRNFKDEIGWRPDNPYIEHAAVRDLEDRIQNIVKADITINNGIKLVGRNAEILRNFSAYYDHNKLENSIRLSRMGITAAIEELYGELEPEENCSINTNDAYFPAEKGEENWFSWNFKFGECENGVAHGIGYAATNDLNTHFVGKFDYGKMVEGLFQTIQSNGKRVTQVGGVTTTNYTARFLTSVYSDNGFEWHRYGDLNDKGHFDGFFINIHNYTNQMLVHSVGSIKDNELNGFAAKQKAGTWGDGGESYHVWLGNYENDALNGLGAWTDGTTSLIVGEWENGQLNGVGYRQYSDYTGDYRSVSVGRWVNGSRHGPHKALLANSFNSGSYDILRYNHGEFLGYDSDYNTDFSQIFAIAAGAAMLSVADIPAENAIEIGTAMSLDIINETGGSNLANLQQHYASQPQASPPNSNNSAANSITSNGGIKYYEHLVKCDSGTQSTISIPYRTDECRRAAIQFTETYACNKLDQQRVMDNCFNACGHQQCLQN